MPGRVKSERRAQTFASGSSAARAGTLSPGTIRESPKGRAARSGARKSPVIYSIVPISSNLCHS